MKLTPQQKLVYNLLVEGDTNKQIAFKLGLELETIKFHVSNLLKLHKCKSRSLLIVQHYKTLLNLI